MSGGEGELATRREVGEWRRTLRNLLEVSNLNSTKEVEGRLLRKHFRELQAFRICLCVLLTELHLRKAVVVLCERVDRGGSELFGERVDVGGRREGGH